MQLVQSSLVHQQIGSPLFSQVHIQDFRPLPNCSSRLPSPIISLFLSLPAHPALTFSLGLSSLLGTRNDSTPVQLTNMIITPRTAAYERLETGVPVFRRGSFLFNLSKSYFLTGWHHLVAIEVTILLFLFLFARSSHSSPCSSSERPVSSSPHSQLMFETDRNPLFGSPPECEERCFN